MLFLRFMLVALLVMSVSACGDEPVQQDSSSKNATTGEDAGKSDSSVANNASGGASGGSVSVTILPQNPTSSDCLRAVIQGVAGRSAIVWKVNETVVASGTSTEFCGDNFKRDDTVSVEVGTSDQGGQASVSIANSPPRVTDISSTPDQIFAGVDITVTPVAEDADGDDVDFYYQWLINGEADPTATEATLPGSKFSKGDSIQVQITPNDFLADGPVYESYSQPVPNAPPEIISQPPNEITSIDYEYRVEVNDPDDSVFTFRLDEAPENMSIDESSGVIKWPLDGVIPGDYTIAIVVADPEGAEGAQEYKLTLGAPK